MSINEVQKDVPGWEGMYKVSNFGRCYSVRMNKIKALDVNSYGYPRLQCYDKETGRKIKLFVHQLVACLFVDGYEEGLVVDHIDGCKSNNMYTNLRQVTRSQNNKLAFEQKLKKRGKYKVPCYLDFNGKKVYFETVCDAARSIGLSDKRLHHCIRTHNGYIPEIDAYIVKCVSND